MNGQFIRLPTSSYRTFSSRSQHLNTCAHTHTSEQGSAHRSELFCRQARAAGSAGHYHGESHDLHQNDLCHLVILQRRSDVPTNVAADADSLLPGDACLPPSVIARIGPENHEEGECTSHHNMRIKLDAKVLRKTGVEVINVICDPGSQGCDDEHRLHKEPCYGEAHRWQPIQWIVFAKTHQGVFMECSGEPTLLV